MRILRAGSRKPERCGGRLNSTVGAVDQRFVASRPGATMQSTRTMTLVEERFNCSFVTARKTPFPTEAAMQHRNRFRFANPATVTPFPAPLLRPLSGHGKRWAKLGRWPGRFRQASNTKSPHVLDGTVIRIGHYPRSGSPFFRSMPRQGCQKIFHPGRDTLRGELTLSARMATQAI
jgi:hypothetical protein